MRPTLSIVLPTFESTTGLQRIVNFLLTDNRLDDRIEFIVSDDSKSDLIKNFVSKHKSFKYIKHSNTGNPVDNWNHGIEMSNGRYIHVLHHDEYYKNYKQLHDLLRILESSPDVVVLKCMLSKGHVSVLVPNWVKVKLLKKAHEILHFKNFLGSPSNIIFRNDKNYFNRSFIWLVDIDFYFNLMHKYVLEAWTVSEVEIFSDLVHFRGNSISISLRQSLQEIEKNERDNLIQIHELKKNFSLKNKLYFYFARALGYVSL